MKNQGVNLKNLEPLMVHKSLLFTIQDVTPITAKTREEIMGISQIVTSSEIKFSKSVRCFTEQGVAMFTPLNAQPVELGLSSVLRSKRAVQVNIQIMRAFTQLRKMLSTHEDLKRKIESMEKKYDEQ